ncbi:MAG TPA: class I SAM-dependent methyltransferase [Actinophytocola sp.]|uniref:class I SAM-dependent methyltransferase n=1 Tax=Actinophytocola sp. TaxID=1872138 RepID=UPI002DDCE71B|nr:class I SAM-dependent methyltransferase [Actinophytocola sp.]HEV2784036.1 class I SAM-dependent methyltransferase [Actinophytocola sp.]
MAESVDFEAAWALAEDIPGWLTRDQGRALWDAAHRLGPGRTVLEIGSHQGRSTVILGIAARSVGASVIAVDPFVDWLGGASIRERFAANVAKAGLDGVVELVVGYSTKLRPTWTRPIHLLYIDGKHDYWTYTDDLRWSAHLPPDAEILVHDCFSSIGVTSGTLAKVLAGTRYSYVDRVGSLARFTLRRPSLADRWRVVRELPWFTRNVIIKVLLRLRLRPATRLLGHRAAHDPY